MRASLREMARPSPVPPYRRAVRESAWVKSWKSFACCSAVMPIPLSATASSTHSRPSATLRTRSATSPSFVNLPALLSDAATPPSSDTNSLVGQREQLVGHYPSERVLADGYQITEFGPQFIWAGILPECARRVRSYP